MVNESLQSLSSLYIASCGVEGKSPATLRSYAETLKIFMRAVKRLRLPDDPGLKAAQAHASFSPGDRLATLPAA